MYIQGTMKKEYCNLWRYDIMMEITLKQLKDLISQNKENTYVVSVNQSYELLRHEPVTYLVCNKWEKVVNVYRIERHYYNEKADTLKIKVYYLLQQYQEIRIKELNKIPFNTLDYWNKRARDEDLNYSLHGESNEKRRCIARYKIYNLLNEVSKL